MSAGNLKDFVEQQSARGKTPDEIRRIDEGSILLFIQQHPVYEVGKPRYYQLAHLTGLYDPNPYRQNAKPHLITEADIRGKK